MIADTAKCLAEAMIDSGRDPLWVVLVVGWTYGNIGRQVALELIEGQAKLQVTAQ